MWIFRARLWQLIRGTLYGERSEVMFMRNLFIAFLPAAVIGAVMIKYIKDLFHNPGVFVVTLIVGGLIMLWVERKPPYAKTAVPGADAQGDDCVSSGRDRTSVVWGKSVTVS